MRFPGHILNWATREMEDLKTGRTLSAGQFKLRVSQLLTSYGGHKAGERFNYYERLLRGMPTRLANCRANKLTSSVPAENESLVTRCITFV